MFYCKVTPRHRNLLKKNLIRCDIFGEQFLCCIFPESPVIVTGINRRFTSYIADVCVAFKNNFAVSGISSDSYISGQIAL
jgi:hypothetical protein